MDGIETADGALLRHGRDSCTLSQEWLGCNHGLQNLSQPRRQIFAHIRHIFAHHNIRYGIIVLMAPAPTLARLEALAAQLLNRVENANTRGMYRKALFDFLEWWHTEGDLPLDRNLIQAHLGHLQRTGYSPSTVNQRLAAVRKLVGEAAEEGLLDLSCAAAILRLPGVRREHVRKWSWLTASEAETLINAPDPSTKKGVRDRALLALLVGCALRRSEIVSLEVEDIQKRDGRWVLLDLVGKHGRVRTVAVPRWAKEALDSWLQVADLRQGPAFRAVDREGKVLDRAISAQSVLPIVVGYGRAVGINVKPHDLRRTCAQLCRAEGGELEQIQLLLGHSNIQTTQRYLGTKQNLTSAPNDRLRMKWYNSRKLAS